MAKSYTEELAEWVSKRKAQRRRQDKNIVAFLAVKGDVKAALDAGYSMKTIWEHLREIGRIEYRYETFTLHVKRHIRAKPLTEHQEQPAPLEPSKPQAPAAATKPDQAQGEPRKTPPPSVGGFTFNATSKKEDLF